jgi:hypothetical protein
MVRFFTPEGVVREPLLGRYDKSSYEADSGLDRYNHYYLASSAQNPKIPRSIFNLLTNAYAVHSQLGTYNDAVVNSVVQLVFQLMIKNEEPKIKNY